VARPIKHGLDYFALDVTMNDEVEIIEAEHGLEGFAILIKLFQKIYSEGYYYDWRDKEQILFSNRVSVDRNKVVRIVSDCLKWNIFNREMFEKYGILTSRRIQNQYFSSTYKRTGIDVVREYLLIDVSDRANVSISSITDINNEESTIVCDDKSTQSKVKKSKVNKSKEKDIYIQFAENVKMTEIEYQKLVDAHTKPVTDKMIEILDNYKGASGKSYKSDYRAILNWVVDRVNKEGSNGKFGKHDIQNNESNWPDISHIYFDPDRV
jgi:hypothetical protein